MSDWKDEAFWRMICGMKGHLFPIRKIETWQDTLQQYEDRCKRCKQRHADVYNRG